jgi:hypothetical protein
MAAPVHSGSNADSEPGVAGRVTAAAVDREWLAAELTDRREAEQRTKAGLGRAVAWVAPAGLLAAAASTALWWTPGFSATDTGVAIVASSVAALLTVSVVPLTSRLSGADDRLLFVAALASTGAAAIHFSVIGMHFAEYTLYGVFFVVCSVAQLIWPGWLLLRRSTPLLVLGAVGNAAVVALWMADRTGVVPIGPDATEPPPYGLADSVASGLEIVLVVCCVAGLLRVQRRRLRPGATLVLTTATAVLTTVGLLSVLGVAPSVLPPAM